MIEIKYDTARFYIIEKTLYKCRIPAIRAWFRMIKDEPWHNVDTKHYLETFIPNETRAAKGEMDLAAERFKQDKRYREIARDSKREYDQWNKINSMFKEILG